MATVNYILFELELDPGNKKPIGIYCTRECAEEDQLVQQQTRAQDYNTARTESHYKGFGTGPKRNSDDYSRYFSIEEVLTP